jgi:DNA-binding transcriptional LysR family regulator
MRIKFRQVEHMLAVSRMGSFRGASADKHLSQPAMSRSVRSLEEALGVPLFDRLGNEVRLTRFGEAFIERAEKILLDVAELEREMSLMKGLGSGRFTVAMASFPAAISGRRALAELLREHPGLQIRFTMPMAFEVARMIKGRQADLGVAEVSHLLDMPEFSVEVIGQHEVVFYCRPGHPMLSCEEPLSEHVIDQYPFAGLAIPQRIAHLFPRNVNIDEATRDALPPIFVEDQATACCIIASTDAFGAATPLQLESWLKAGTVVVVPWRSHYLRLNYGFIHLRGRSLSPAAEAFMAIVRDIEREQAQQNRVLADQVFRDIGLAA